MNETVASKVGGALPTRGGSAGEAQQMLSPVLHPLLLVLLPQLEGGGKEMQDPDSQSRSLADCAVLGTPVGGRCWVLPSAYSPPSS